MKYAIICLAGLLLAGCKGTPGSGTSLKNDRDKTSYALGLNIGKRMLTDSLDVNPEIFARGITDAAKDSSGRLLTDQEVQTVLAQLDQNIMKKRMAASTQLTEKNKKMGEEFLEQNKKREGVTTLPSGLQYEVITEGNGPMPKRGQTVQTRYRGMTVDGTEFDASAKHGGTVTFQVDQVIPGWREALLKMKVGSKWKLFIPSALAYGERGAGGAIGPNCALILDIELVAIK